MKNAKDYLGMAYKIDQRIESKIEQVDSLNALATKATSTISDMPGSATRNIHRMEDVITKIIDLQESINNDIDALVDLKAEITGMIKRIDNLEYQTVLEQRYLCFTPWEQIAINMNYGVQNVFRYHRLALVDMDALLDELDAELKDSFDAAVKESDEDASLDSIYAFEDSLEGDEYCGFPAFLIDEYVAKVRAFEAQFTSEEE